MLCGTGRSSVTKIGLEAVVAHLRNAAAPKLVPAAKDRMGVTAMIGPVERWSQPQVPVEIRRDGRLVGGKRELMRPERPSPDRRVIAAQIDALSRESIVAADKLLAIIERRPGTLREESRPKPQSMRLSPHRSRTQICNFATFANSLSE